MQQQPDDDLSELLIQAHPQMPHQWQEQAERSYGQEEADEEEYQQREIIEEELGEDEEDEDQYRNEAHQMYNEMYDQQLLQVSGEDEGEEEDDEEEDEEDAIGEMKAKFDKIMATFVDDQNRIGGGQHMSHKPLSFAQAQTPSSKVFVKESITEFKNKNLQNNMKELIRGTDESEEEETD